MDRSSKFCMCDIRECVCSPAAATRGSAGFYKTRVREMSLVTKVIFFFSRPQFFVFFAATKKEEMEFSRLVKIKIKEEKTIFQKKHCCRVLCSRRRLRVRDNRKGYLAPRHPSVISSMNSRFWFLSKYKQIKMNFS